jgi:hypothetical protein
MCEAAAGFDSAVFDCGAFEQVDLSFTVSVVCFMFKQHCQMSVIGRRYWLNMKNARKMKHKKEWCRGNILGGFTMMKIKLVTTVLLVLGAGLVAPAAEVISVDLNGYNDNNPYIGNGAYDVGNRTWTVYYGGWGKAVGSPRSDQLADYNEPNQPGIYAAQVWIGDPGTNHTYVSGTGLMDDGFVKAPGATADPTIRLWGMDAYGGTFDIYVYGSSLGSFTISSPSNEVHETNSVSGGVPPGQFINGGNYVVFRSIPISFDPNYITLSYSGTINGLQLVKLKQPVAIQDGTEINAPDYDVAYDTNRREGEGQHFGPDVNELYVFYIDDGEYMKYDITVDEANKGRYDILAWVNTGSEYCTNLNVYLDDIWLGVLKLEEDSTTDPPYYYDPTQNSVSVNLFKGSHTFKWAHIGGGYGYNISSFTFTRTSDVIMNDCNDVYTYGLNYAGDFNGDCHVDEKDLALIVDNWLVCYDPNANNCP